MELCLYKRNYINKKDVILSYLEHAALQHLKMAKQFLKYLSLRKEEIITATDQWCVDKPSNQNFNECFIRL